MDSFERESRFDVPADTLFDWHSRPGAFERLTPPWENVEIADGEEPLHEGLIKVLKMHQGPIALTWKALHRDLVEGRQFVDEQVSGPFARWEHCHRFEPADNGSVLRDHIDFRLPVHPISKWVAGPSVRRKLERMFEFRHRRTHHDIARHQEFADRDRLAVAVTGASGLLGSQLQAFLTTGGHTVRPMVRRREQVVDDEIYWNPREGVVDTSDLEGLDAVVHLAGENVFALRWTEAKKQRIRRSRVDGTRALAEALARMDDPPKTLICASAVGYYGDRGDELLTEDSESGAGFLADVCREWEAAADAAREAGIRVVHARIGVVLTPAGGALDTMLPAFKAGVGGPIGSGEQYMSWIDVDDVVGALHFALFTDTLAGPVNVTAPTPVANADFAHTLGDVLNRPSFMRVPGFALKAAMGEVAQETVLNGQRVVPEKLEDAGFEFLYRDLEASLRAELGR